MKKGRGYFIETLKTSTYYRNNLMHYARAYCPLRVCNIYIYIQNHVKHIYSVNYNNFITAIDLPTTNISI